VYKRSRRDESTKIDDETKRFQSIIRELRVLTHGPLLAHSNIVRLIGYFWEADEIPTLWPVLVLEFADCGSLAELLHDAKMPRFPFQSRERICLDVLHGLDALHQCQVIWGDCKPANILLFSTGTSPYELMAKITDFGYAVINPRPDEKVPGATKYWQDHIDGVGFEQLCSSDVYSAGLVIGAVMSSGKHFDKYSHQPQTVEDAGLDARIRIAKISGALLDDLKCVIREALRPTSTKQSQSALASTLELGCVEEAIKFAVLDRTSLRLVIECLQYGTRFQSRYVLSERRRLLLRTYRSSKDYALPMEAIALSSIRVEQNHDHSATTFNEKVFQCLDEYLQNCTNTSAQVPVASHVRFELGMCHAIGFGVKQDKSKAKEYIEAAAEDGSLDAQALLVKFRDQANRPASEWLIPSDWLWNGAKAGSWIAVKGMKEFKGDLSELHKFLAMENSKSLREVWNSPRQLEVMLEDLETHHESINEAAFTERADKALHIAALEGDLEAFQVILKHQGMDINVRNNLGETPLMCAMRASNRTFAEQLMEKGAEVALEDVCGITALHWLINCRGSGEEIAGIAKRIIARGGILNAKSRYALRYSAIYGATLPPGTPLDWAIHTSNLDAFIALAVDQQADLGSEMNEEPPALHRLALNHQHELLLALNEELLSRVVLKLDTKGNSALWYALQPINALDRLVHDTFHREGESRTLKHLIDKHADMDYVNSLGETALYAAVRAGAQSCIEFLVENYKPRTQKMLHLTSGPQRLSPFRRAIYANSSEIFQCLLHNAKDYDWDEDISPDGMTLLHECCFAPESVGVIIAELLLAELQRDCPDADCSECRKAKKKILNKRGKSYALTPLQLAVLCNKAELARTFFQHGANPLEGYRRQRFLGYLLEYQTFAETHVTSLLETIIDDDVVRSARRLPHPAQIISAVKILLKNDVRWFNKGNERLTDEEHKPNLILSDAIVRLRSFIVASRDNEKQAIQYGSRWITALDLALDCIPRSAFPKPAEDVFTEILNHWNTPEHVNFPHTHILHNRSTKIRNLRRRETLLHRAVRIGKLSIVDSLLRAGADWEMANHEWFSPLHLAKNIAYPNHLEGYDVQTYATSFWGRLNQPHEILVTEKPTDLTAIVDKLRDKERAGRTNFVVVRALREIWWPWDDYEIDSFGYKHILLWGLGALVVLFIVALLFFIGDSSRPTTSPTDLVHNVTNFIDTVAMDAMSVVTHCVDECYRNGSDPVTVCGLAWLNRMHAGNARLSLLSDFIIQRELDCYDLAKSRNESYDACKKTLTPRYFLNEIPLRLPGFNFDNMTSELCTIEFKFMSTNESES
jgi:ankyrin repeat protein